MKTIQDRTLIDEIDENISLFFFNKVTSKMYTLFNLQNVPLNDEDRDHLIQNLLYGLNEYCISHYFRVQLFSRFWTFAVIREWLISRFF